MESKFVFLLLLVCVAAQDSSDSGDSGSTSEDDFSYPCSLDDLDCIRDYFAQTEMCSKASHEDGQSIQRDILVAYVPKFNGTFICLEDTITFYGSEIEAFYVNKQSNNLVMAINFEGINIYTARGILAVDVRGQEPEMATDHINVTYSAAVTAVVPNRGLNGVAGAAVSSYNTNAMPPFELGPNISDSSNEVIEEFYQALLNDIPTAVQELLLTKAPYLFYIYLQEYICNFGIEYTGAI